MTKISLATLALAAIGPATAAAHLVRRRLVERHTFACAWLRPPMAVPMSGEATTHGRCIAHVMSSGTKRRQQTRHRKLDAELDAALMQTFPASDPVSIGGATGTEPPARPLDRKAPIIARDEPAAGRKQARRRTSRAMDS